MGNQKHAPALSISAALTASLMLAGIASAGTIYYDTNGTTAGTGTSVPDWNSSSNEWSTDSAGLLATGSWTAGGSLDNSDVVFSAGTNAPTSYTINTAGSKPMNSLTIEEGAITLRVLGASAATRTIGAGGITIADTTAGSSASGPLTFLSPAGATAGTFNVVVSASQTWNNNNLTNTQAVVFAPITFANPLTLSGNATAGNTTTVTLAGAGSGAYAFGVVVGDGTGGGKLAVSTSKATNFTNVVSTFSGGYTITGGATTLDNGGGLGHSNITITGGSLAGGTTGTGGFLTDNLVGDTGELISLSGTGVLNLSGINFTLAATGTQTLAEYVLANKGVGSANVTGTAFASAALPAGWTIDYDGTTANPGDIVLVNGNASTPEPAALGLLSLAGLGLARRRRA